MKIEIYNKPLPSEKFLYWASMPFWHLQEALLLSMGLDPREEGKHISADVATNNGIEFWSRMEVMKRGFELESNSIPFSKISDEEGESPVPGDEEAVFTPHNFHKWAVKANISIPEGLCQAITGNLVDRNSKAHENKESPAKGNAGSDARWDSKRQILLKANKCLEKTRADKCTCDHVQLAEYMFYNATDNDGNTLFEYPDVPEGTLQKYLKQAAKEFLTHHNTQRIVGSRGYMKSDAHCENHPHR